MCECKISSTYNLLVPTFLSSLILIYTFVHIIGTEYNNQDFSTRLHHSTLRCFHNIKETGKTPTEQIWVSRPTSPDAPLPSISLAHLHHLHFRSAPSHSLTVPPRIPSSSPWSALSLKFLGRRRPFPRSGLGPVITAPNITLLAPPVAAYKTGITFAPAVPSKEEVMSESTRRAAVLSTILGGKHGGIGVGI